MPYICLILNLFIISPRDEAVNSCPYASPLFEVAKPRTITALWAIIIIIMLRKGVTIWVPHRAAKTHSTPRHTNSQWHHYGWPEKHVPPNIML